jgi:hypothetical protein
MLGKCVFAAFLTLIPLAARADQWIVLNGGDRTCEVPHAPAESPAATERHARDQGMFDKTEVSRNDDGTIRMVSVQVVIDGRKSAMVFFKDRQTCQKFLSEWSKARGFAKELE